MVAVHGLLATPVLNAEHLLTYYHMAEKFLHVPARGYIIHKTKDAHGLFVVTTLLHMVISFLYKKMEVNFWPIPAKDFMLQEMKEEVG